MNTKNVVEAFDGSRLGWILVARRAVRAFVDAFLEIEEASFVSESTRGNLADVVRSDSPPLRLRLEVVDELGRKGAEVSVRFHPCLGSGSSVEIELDWPETASGFEFLRFLRSAERATVVARVIERILGELR